MRTRTAGRGRGRGRGRPPKQSPSPAAVRVPEREPQGKEEAVVPDAAQEAKDVEVVMEAAATPPADEKKAPKKGELPASAVADNVEAAEKRVGEEGNSKEVEVAEKEAGEEGKSKEFGGKGALEEIEEAEKKVGEEHELEGAGVAEKKVGEEDKSQGDKVADKNDGEGGKSRVVEAERDFNRKVQEEGTVKEEDGRDQEVVDHKMEDVMPKDVVVGGAKEKEEGKQVEGAPVNDGEMGAEVGEYPEEHFEEPTDGGEREAASDGQGAQVDDDEQMLISDMAKKRKLKKELEIFVGGLDRDAVEDDIKKTFEQVGEVLEVRLHRDFATNKNKGFAFVKFANKDQVARALAEMKNPLIHGKRCGIAASEDNDTLFLGNICNTWTKEAIKRKLHDYGIEVENITLVLDTQNVGLSRGFAFLEFSCHADAMLAFKRLQKPDVVFGHPERTAKVAFAEPIREPDPEIMAQVKSVFIDGLPPYWDEDRVKEQFKTYGEIERVVLARNMSTAKRNDFGFVNFTTHESALACIESTNNTELGDDGKSKVKVRVRLANPLPKSQAVKGGMSGGFRIGYPGAGSNRFGRGFGRGRFLPRRAGFQGGRGFNNLARGGGGRFNFAANNNSSEALPSGFQGRPPFGFQGGRWQSSPRWHDSFGGRGFGRGYPPPRRPPFEPNADFVGAFGEDPYFYGDGGRGLKRPFSVMEHDPGYFEPGPPLMRPRFDHHDHLLSGGSHYRESFGMGNGSHYRESFGMGNLHSRDFYGPGRAPDQYGSSTYSSLYRGGHSGGGYYY